MLNLVLTEEVGAAAAAREALREENGTCPLPSATTSFCSSPSL